MIRLHLKDGHIRQGTLPEVLATATTLIDSMTLDGPELQRVVRHAMSPIPLSAKSLNEMIAGEKPFITAQPEVIEQALVILRDAQLPRTNYEGGLGKHIDSAIGILQTARAMASELRLSPDEARIHEACRTLLAKGYPVDYILGILDAQHRLPYAEAVD